MIRLVYNAKVRVNSVCKNRLQQVAEDEHQTLTWLIRMCIMDTRKLRPPQPKPYDKTLSVRLDDFLIKRIEEYKPRDMSVSEWIRRCVTNPERWYDSRRI